MDGLRTFLHTGGFFMYVNFAVSGVVLAIIAERTYYFLGKGAVNASAFLDQLKAVVYEIHEVEKRDFEDLFD